MATTTSHIEPAFWFGFEVSAAKLVVGRVVLFGLLACDALLQIRHAPRYGAGGFNVAQLPGLDGLGPTRSSFESAELVLAYVFALIACGVATRMLIPLAAIVYSWLYFGSQLDSFQHHYLVAMILLLACFVPWRAEPSPAPPMVQTWALRLIMLELAIMYLWAAISKMNSAWTTGATLSSQIGGPLRAIIDHTIGIALASKLVIVVELVLAATVWNPRTWRIAAPLGLLFHLGIVFTGLEIGLFAVLMIGLYVFVVPDRIWIALAARTRGRLAIPPRARWMTFGAGLAIGLVLALTCRFEAARRVAIVASVAIVGYVLLSRAARCAIARLGIAQLLAFALWFGVDRSTTVAADYYKFWGGTSRRLKDTDTAEHAYRRLVEIAPGDPGGHYQLGRLLLERGGDDDDGLAQLHEAETHDGKRTRAYVYEARWLAAHHRTPEAIAKAREAEAMAPGDPELRDLLGALTAGSAPNPSHEP